ncbi:MAG: 16S rRNA processing protein RimM [Deltaproteobacteria bacterium]|nr:MAG: 16S rRNA processing protein RimM [Deltaproteobacteria bacterium]
MTSQPTEELMAVAVVAGTHGLRGDLKLRALPTAAAALPGLRELYLQAPDGTRTLYRILQSKPHKQHQLVRLAGLESLDLVQPLVGRTALARCADLPALPGGEHYWHELDGLSVIDVRRGPLGRVVGLFATGAHDILTVDGAHGEILIPFIPRFVVHTDLAAGELQVDLPDGLVPGDDAL